VMGTWAGQGLGAGSAFAAVMVRAGPSPRRGARR
jgi:hypothetical protein